jgi:hypothetical protein
MEGKSREQDSAMIFRIAFLGVITWLIVLLSGCKDDRALFTALPSSQTGISFSNSIRETDTLNINEYLYAHNGGGVGVGDFNNDGLADLYFTSNQGSNKLYYNKGSFTFEDVTHRAGVAGPVGVNYWTTGVTVVDINQDGWLDIYVCQVSDKTLFRGNNQLFVNKGNGTFEEQAAQYGLDLTGYSQQAVFFDYDADGDLDMYQLNHSVHELDVYVTAKNRNKRDALAGDRLFRNDDGCFTDVSKEAGIYGGATGYGLSVAVADLDGNGCPDIYVSNDFHDNDYMYYNQCNGTFKETVKDAIGHTSNFSMGSDVADINNDGLLDLMTLDMKPEDEIIRKSSAGTDPYHIYEFKKSFGFHEQSPRNMLHINQGSLLDHGAQFSEKAQMAGVSATDWSWSVLLADFDNDGYKDIHITNGIVRRPNDLDYINYTYNTAAARKQSPLDLVKKMPDGRSANYAYRNTGEGVFEDVSGPWGLDLFGCSMGAAYADLDNDGDLDLVVNNLNQAATLYRNNTETLNGNNYIKISLAGNKGNIHGIGAMVRVELEDKTLTQDLNPVRGWLSSSDRILTFGLGKADKVKSVTVTWFDGRQQQLFDLQPNQMIRLDYEKAVFAGGAVARDTPLVVSERDTGLDFTHRENKYVDFNAEGLIPHKISAEGPSVCVADVNDDGLEDVYVGGAAGQEAALYLQIRQGERTSFIKQQIPAFGADKLAEDVDAIFFDADGDTDPDLYVVSGGGQLNNRENQQDRLYLNQGNGHFIKDTGLSEITSNGSVVVAADFNEDGALDLFVGSRSLPGSYGLAPDSYLLWNEGMGKFTVDTTSYVSPLKGLGMVTDASWDAREKKLVVVGEWMPVTIINFSGKRLEKREIPKSSGWWNTLTVSDLDGDGDLDLLVGNLGTNTALQASTDKPLKLLVRDWDKNGSVDPLLAYHKQGEEWLYNGLDELKRQMPVIGGRFTQYKTYAHQTLDRIFSKEELALATIKTAVLLESGVFRNQGGSEYIFEPLPAEVQSAPVYDFLLTDINMDGVRDVLAGGNNSGFAPSIGQLDASYGNLLLGIKAGGFRYVPARTSGFAIPGEIRKLKEIAIGDAPCILVGRNNESVEVFRPIRSSPISDSILSSR